MGRGCGGVVSVMVSVMVVIRDWEYESELLLRLDIFHVLPSMDILTLSTLAAILVDSSWLFVTVHW